MKKKTCFFVVVCVLSLNVFCFSVVTAQGGGALSTASESFANKAGDLFLKTLRGLAAGLSKTEHKKLLFSMGKSGLEMGMIGGVGGAMIGGAGGAMIGGLRAIYQAGVRTLPAQSEASRILEAGGTIKIPAAAVAAGMSLPRAHAPSGMINVNPLEEADHGVV